MPENLPNEILEMVTNRLNMFDKIRLRRVSKRLRSVVYLDKNSYCDVYISVADSEICLKLRGRMGRLELIYKKCKEGTSIQRTSLGGGDKLIRGTNFMDVAQADIKSLISLRTTIGRLEVHQTMSDSEKTAHFWQPLCNWNVPNLKIVANNGFQVHVVLKVVQPTVLTDMRLEFVRIGFSIHTNAFSISQCVNSDQWKQLNMFKSRSLIRKSNLQHLSHLKQIDVISEVECEDVVRFCLVLSNSNVLESAVLRFTDRLPVPRLVAVFRKTNMHIAQPSWNNVLRIAMDEFSSTFVKLTERVAVVMRKLATDQDEEVIIEKIEKLTYEVTRYNTSI